MTKLDHEAPTGLSEALIGKINRRLIPFLVLLFVVNYLDRTNLAMAKLRMEGDVGLDDTAIGLGAGLFFVGYFLFEVPSNLILARVGARRWIARIMISWGLVSAALMFTNGPKSFCILRFVLGLAEAGFFPGVVLYLTYWIPSRRRARTLAGFLTATALSGLIGNPLAGLIMKLDGVGQLHGWQWLFLLEGILPVLLGILVLVSPILPDRPSQARWLDAEQRQAIERELDHDGSHTHVNHIQSLGSAIGDGRLWLLSVIYFLLIMGLYGFIYWVPSMVKDWLSGAGELRIGMLSAIPYLVAAIGMLIIGRSADHRGHRRAHVALCAATAAVGLLLLIPCHSPISGLLAMSIAAIGIFGSLGPFWCIPTRFLRGRAAAGGIAVVNSVGALSGFVAPPVMGWAKQHTGSFGVGLGIVAASLVCGAVLVLCVPPTVDQVD